MYKNISFELDKFLAVHWEKWKINNLLRMSGSTLNSSYFFINSELSSQILNSEGFSLKPTMPGTSETGRCLMILSYILTFQAVGITSRPICSTDRSSKPNFSSSYLSLDSSLTRFGVEYDRGSVLVSRGHFSYLRENLAVC